MSNDLFGDPECPDCVKAGGVYSFKCAGCRDRFLMDEPCKVYRQIMVEYVKRWGSVGDWKRKPSCGCEKQCERLQAIRNASLDS